MHARVEIVIDIYYRGCVTSERAATECDARVVVLRAFCDKRAARGGIKGNECHTDGMPQ